MFASRQHLKVMTVANSALSAVVEVLAGEEAPRGDSQSKQLERAGLVGVILDPPQHFVMHI